MSSDKSDFGLSEDIGLPYTSALRVTYWASDRVVFEVYATSGVYANTDLIPTSRFVIQGEPQISQLRDLLQRDPRLEWEDRSA